MTDSPAKKRRIIVGISGSSGPHYGIRLLEVLSTLPNVETHLVVSGGAVEAMRHEAPEWTLEKLGALASVVHSNEDLAASISSGSFLTDGMVVAPCSMSTLSGIAHASSNNLLLRAADVCLKERRRLVVVPRETPLHRGHLENMLRVTDLGAIVLPPVPAFYHRPKSIADLLDHTVGKVLDLLSVEHDLFRRWA